MTNPHGLHSSGSVKSKRGSRPSIGAASQRSSKTHSLLSAGGDAKSVSHADLEGSPSQSRSSSAEGSYSTSATTFEDGDETAGMAKSSSKSKDTKETKGNVIVSVRVRPNVSGESSANPEWMVDTRRGLLVYNGKEGGDYYYGNTRLRGR